MKHNAGQGRNYRKVHQVAFTPKGGCPLKQPPAAEQGKQTLDDSSIHPQGWVPVETGLRSGGESVAGKVAFTPKGGCPLKQMMMSPILNPRRL